MEIQSLASGSSGNAYIIKNRGRSLLLDAGLSGRRIFACLKVAAVDPAEITGILLSHEHNDHISGAGILSRRLQIPLYLTAGTWLGAREKLGPIPEDRINLISPGTAFTVNDLEIWPLPASHDAIEPVNYLFNTGLSRGAVITDTGCVSEGVLRTLAACAALVLEANHDEEMLRSGPYPRSLKARVAGVKGHLSNRQAARLLLELAGGGRVNRVHLGHLSVVNNSQEIALATVTAHLAAAGMEGEPIYHNLTALPRHWPGPVLQVK